MNALTSQVKIKNPSVLFANSGVSDKDTRRYTQLISEGNDQQAIDEFLAKYITPYVEAYQGTMQDYLSQVEKGQISNEDSNKLEESLALLALGLSTLMSKNFNTILSPLSLQVFADNNIVTADIKKAILDQTLAQFEQLTKGAMMETQNNVLTYVRTLQKEMIIENQMIYEKKLIGDILDNEILAFRKSLEKKYPDIYKAIENGQILKSRLLPDGSSINYKLDYYSEMSIRTTLLNVDRTAVEVTATIDEKDVVEYYLRDTRTVKDARSICIHVLSQKINGKSLLALTPSASNKLGIMSIDSARSQGAMGIHCRHSIKQVSAQFEKEIGL